MKPKRVIVIGADYPELEKYCPNWAGMKAGLARMDLEWKFVSCRPALNVQEVVDFKPDLIVYALLDMIKNFQWRKEIREKCPGAAIVFWYGDYRDERTGQVMHDCSTTIDAMFVSNASEAQKVFYRKHFRIEKIHFLPLGCEPMRKPVINKMFAFDFVFIGGQISEGAFHARAEMIEKFKLQAGLVMVNSFEPTLRAKIFKEMPAIYGSSRVALDISHFTDVPGYTSIRYFEIPAMWGFPLTKRFPGCTDLYPEDARAYFNTFEEAVTKKRYYLNNPGVVDKMRQRAHEISYNHTYDKRFSKMFSLI